MLYVDGMEGIASHTDTIQWLYTLLSSQVLRLISYPLNHEHKTEIILVA